MSGILPAPAKSGDYSESISIDLRFTMTNTRRVAVPCMIDMIIFGVLRVRSTTHTTALHICYIRGHLRNDRFLAP